MSQVFECLDCGEMWKLVFASGHECPNCLGNNIIEPHKDQGNLFERKNEQIVQALNDNWSQVFYALTSTSKHDIDVDVRADAETALKELKAALEVKV